MIKFNDYVFSEPALLPAASTLADTLIGQAGLYVILVPDSTCSPRPYRALYFGESDNINGRACGTHENWSAWCRHAGTSALYRALCPLPGFTKIQRQLAESLLITKYGTPCNDRLSFDFARLLGGLGGERR